MRHLGVQGYQDSAKEIMRARDEFKATVEAQPELCVLGDPASSIVAFTSTKKGFNIFAVRALHAFP